MPAKSKQQFKFMKAVESGSIKDTGLSKKQAQDFTKDMTKSKWKLLKERVKAKK